MHIYFEQAVASPTILSSISLGGISLHHYNVQFCFVCIYILSESILVLRY